MRVLAKKSERITHGNKSLKTTLTEAASAASHTKDTFLKRKYNSLVGRQGKKRALIAVDIRCFVPFIPSSKTKNHTQSLIRKYSKPVRAGAVVPHLKLAIKGRGFTGGCQP